MIVLLTMILTASVMMRTTVLASLTSAVYVMVMVSQMAHATVTAM